MICGLSPSFLIKSLLRLISSSSSFPLFLLLASSLLLFDFSSAHYNQPQYGVPAQQQQYHQVPVQQQQQQQQYQQAPPPQQQQYQQQVPVPQQQQQVPVQGQQQVYHQQPPQQQQQHPQGQIPHYQQQPNAGSNVLHDDTRIHDREHMKEHLHEALGDQDVNKLSEEELQFHYFKMHDNDNNNMLDGSELIKSLIHWHVEESKQLGQNAPTQGTTKVFTDQELEQMIDPILQMDDKNNDGFIDYPEFIAAQKHRGF